MTERRPLGYSVRVAAAGHCYLEHGLTGCQAAALYYVGQKDVSMAVSVILRRPDLAEQMAAGQMDYRNAYRHIPRRPRRTNRRSTIS